MKHTLRFAPIKYISLLAEPGSDAGSREQFGVCGWVAACAWACGFVSTGARHLVCSPNSCQWLIMDFVYNPVPD